jgi:hypothetical protein
VLWWIAWALVVLLAAILLALLATGVLISEFTLNGILAALLGQSVLVAALLAAIKKLGGQISDSFVDVVRYLDHSPRSYEARRAIPAGGHGRPAARRGTTGATPESSSSPTASARSSPTTA